jgi:alginate O-acetyltransferase complex protein AlgI
MAIGLGHMFGFKFKENFNYPYTSLSIQEFWRRWHISLSTWFKEYVYIPLGGNRKGKVRTYINLFIVFLLTGIWHGANFTFIVWGLYFGLFLILERLFLGEWLKKNPIKILNWLYMIIVVMVGWVFFRADNIFQAFEYLRQMFGGFRFENSILTYLSMETIYMLVIAIALCGFAQRLFKPYYEKIQNNNAVVITEFIIQMGLFALCILALVGGTYNPFIYFQF